MNRNSYSLFGGKYGGTNTIENFPLVIGITPTSSQVGEQTIILAVTLFGKQQASYENVKLKLKVS